MVPRNGEFSHAKMVVVHAYVAVYRKVVRNVEGFMITTGLLDFFECGLAQW